MATNESKKRKLQKRQAITRLVILSAILICVNMLAVRFHWGLDLTKEKKFTLTNETKQVLRNMDDVAVITVYLDGKFPAGFQRLKEATREQLQAFRDVAGSNIKFQYMDPFAGKSDKEKEAVYVKLSEKGIFPVNLQVQGEEEGYSERFIFPWALVQYAGREAPIRLLENKLGMDALANLNYSESQLEYKFASAIHKLKNPTKTQLAYIVGHNETLGLNSYDLLNSLAEQYIVDTFDLTGNLYIPSFYKAIIINRPTAPFEDKDKFKIDQYVMNGGKVLWAIDQLNTPMDSLQANGSVISVDYGLNLDDQLFKYGARINSTLVEDRQCAPMPIMYGQPGDNQPRMELREWMYFPVFIPDANHPIVKNLDGVLGMYVSTIDTLTNPEVHKTVLLHSSKYSRKTSAPARVSLSMLQYPLDAMFKTPKTPLPVAILMEGKFQSLFHNRLHPNFLKVLQDSLKRNFIHACDTENSMIVIADGNMLENDFSSKTGPMEMGFWKFTDTRFANKTFVLNCIEYLTDNSGLLSARTKDTRLRLLDANRIKTEGQKWQFVNIGLPVILVLIFASAYLFFRKRKYEKPANNQK
ncbi:MAG: gliding motility-associated ABC transporter substrate-binding protein GldG [Chitinophagales bacterium]|nr:gliding motility-associated ABC transporter substrate-binding protein GldG [Chitinophagales bacterium]